jgi:hypothetical protein
MISPGSNKNDHIEIQSFGRIPSLSRSKYLNKPPVTEISFISDMERIVSISSDLTIKVYHDAKILLLYLSPSIC